MSAPAFDFGTVVGMDAQAAKAAIEAALTGVNVIVLDEGSMVTKDYRTNRVRVYVDPTTQVVKTKPNRG
jgi:hypothetical protein